MEEKILKHIQILGSITTWEAIQQYGCTRLSQYIYLLRNKGYDIDDKRIKVTTRTGNTTTIKRYFIKDKPKKDFYEEIEELQYG